MTILTHGAQTVGWQKYSHEQFGLKSWGASGPYQKVYEKFGITGDSKLSILDSWFMR